MKKPDEPDWKKGESTLSLVKDELVSEPSHPSRTIKQVYELLKEGIRSGEIYATLLIEDPDLNESAFLKILKQSYEYAENQLHKDRDYVFELHMNRYEDIYAKSREMVDRSQRPLNVKKDWKTIVAKHITAMKALRSKEDLIGLHDKSVVLEINEERAVVVEKDDLRGKIGTYEIDNLSLEESKELLELIKKSRTVPIDGVHRVIVKTTRIEITQGERNVVTESKVLDSDTQDIPFEEMPPDVVSKFEDITPNKKKKYHPDDHAGPIVVDAHPDKKADDNKSAEQITLDTAKDINNKVLEAFKEKLRKSKEK